jgi:hypothetical protein
MADKLPEYMRDLIRAVPTDLVKQIAEDFRSYNPHPTQDPSAKVLVQGAGRVVTGDVRPAASAAGQVRLAGAAEGRSVET